MDQILWMYFFWKLRQRREVIRNKPGKLAGPCGRCVAGWQVAESLNYQLVLMPVGINFNNMVTGGLNIFCKFKRDRNM